ncbi:molybdopterin molybdotransferase MoeA [Acidisoma cellulosilytica]|uniref:Molybdopterin molybdenumtransferase n=1 Tax=Acidisoma cellulosilyticum TaxID=2802395 RepID=A0A963YYX6_9PROT|nr:gephyrin-like molybdotransferase Glp [Acidisoma cellulosilyticum]MCB8879610.1 molybdopterin molybdotransferase MoeA [Acidisoma cellulosilyticum]
MISVTEARSRILAGLTPTAGETVSLMEALGRVLAAPLTARLSNPPADVSAMDGYAVRAEDALVGARLRLIGAAPAGHPFPDRLERGETVRLFTGSVVPAGADSILIQENATAEGDGVVVNEATARGRHVRFQGADFTAGETVAKAGQRLHPRLIGLAAGAGHPWVAVHRRPRVVILCTGDEIALPGEPLPPGGVVSSNGPALAALVRAAGGEPILLPTVPDQLPAIIAAAAAARGADMLVTTGGASVGAHDLVQEGLAAAGLVLDFWRIAMRPGKPLMHGKLGDVPMLGLPGNPVSALVCGILFLVPAIERLLGLPGDAPLAEPVRLGADLPANDIREDYVRASLLVREDGGWAAYPYKTQDSGQISRLAAADALLVRPPFAPALATGEMVPAIRLGPLGF